MKFPFHKASSVALERELATLESIPRLRWNCATNRMNFMHVQNFQLGEQGFITLQDWTNNTSLEGLSSSEQQDLQSMIECNKTLELMEIHAALRAKIAGKQHERHHEEPQEMEYDPTSKLADLRPKAPLHGNATDCKNQAHSSLRWNVRHKAAKLQMQQPAQSSQTA
jgi:hypothetical protein